MTRRNLIILGVALCAGAAGAVAAYIGARRAAARVQPYIRSQAIAYLAKRFDSEVQLDSLEVSLSGKSPVTSFLMRRRGLAAHVNGRGLSLRLRGRENQPPILSVQHFTFDVDLEKIYKTPKEVSLVRVEGMEIAVPPKGQRPNFSFSQSDSDQPSESSTGTLIDRIEISNAKLILIPGDASREPLKFDLRNVTLRSAGIDREMKYSADLSIPKPPGDIVSQGNFGPWNAKEPGDTALDGHYTFSHADLGVFEAIAGILESTGTFQGTLNKVSAAGETYTPDFRLTSAGNRVPLRTHFEALVDGTNGNTILKPVRATLGSTSFTTSGAVIKHEGARRRSIDLTVSMPDGHMIDLLRLAMKGPPFMEGDVEFESSIEIPPLNAEVRDKLKLDGKFRVLGGRFLTGNVQQQIDTLSRRGQGQPSNQAIENVFSQMQGSFKLQKAVMTMSDLNFFVPGAQVAVSGAYNLSNDVLDFRGVLRLDARISQTMTGWKHWVLKPIDPFFEKEGAGTLLHIAVTGTTSDPKFGLDHGPKISAKTAGK